MKKKILIVSPNGAGTHYGGPGMNFYRVMEKMDSEFDFDLFHYSTKQEAIDSFKKLYYFNRPPKEVFCRVPFFTKKYSSWINDSFQSYDLVYGLMGFLQTLAPISFFQKLNVPTIVKIASHESELVDKTIREKIFKSSKKRIGIMSNASGIIAISHSIKKELESNGLSKNIIHYIPNGVDSSVFQPHQFKTKARLSKKIKDKFTVLFTGAITERKQPHLILKAIKKMRDRGVFVQGVFVGPVKNDVYKSKMDIYVKKNELKDRIFFYGFQKDLRDFYGLADVFCLPSKKEGMSNSLLEALSSGVPVLATDISGSRELVSDTGMIVKDSQDIADALYVYFSNKSLLSKHSANARLLIEQKFSTDIIASKISSLFHEKIENRGENVPSM